MNPQPSPFAALVFDIVNVNASPEDVAKTAFATAEPTKSQLRVTEAALKELFDLELVARSVKRTYTRSASASV